jgi:UDP-N-acetylmuramate dehydrogenase
MRRELIGFLKYRKIPYETETSAKGLCTFRIGGVCDTVVRPQCPEELMALTAFCAAQNIAFGVLGRGSNVLPADGRIQTVLIKTDALNALRIFDGQAVVQCGCTLPHLARKVAEAGYGDLAFAVGIPGSVGGAVCMNAGAHGREIGDRIEWVEAYVPEERKIRTYFNDELSFSYRNSVFQAQKAVILRAKLRFCQPMKKDEIFDIMRQIMQKRRASQPLELPNAGSIFRRPHPDLPVGKLLEDCGLKGLRCGDAAVSEKHAGFIVNLGNATCADVRMLMRRVEILVKEKTDIRLVPEIREIV